MVTNLAITVEETYEKAKQELTPEEHERWTRHILAMTKDRDVDLFLAMFALIEVIKAER